MSQPQQGFQSPPGLVCWTSHGVVQSATVQSIVEAARYCERSGFHNLTFQEIPGGLVDKARNDAADLLLSTPALQFLIFVDADMTFPPWSVVALIASTYASEPVNIPINPTTAVPIVPTAWADIVGGWCPLRNKPYLPTIDTGTGTWEPHEPNQGPLEVIRTGGAFVLVKRHVFERMERPWYGVRPAPRAIDVIQEFDGYCRQKFDGRNPFAGHKEWEQVSNCARQEIRAPRDHQTPYANVGEDSNFADKARALGFRVVVQSNIVVGHIDRQVITPDMHIAEMKKSRDMARLYAGVMG